jgi:hypothetical protein
MRLLTRAKKAVTKSLMEALSGGTKKDVDDVAQKMQNPETPGDGYMADFRTDRFGAGGLNMTGPVMWNAIAQQTSSATMPVIAYASTAITDTIHPINEPFVPPDAPVEKVAKVKVTPKAVLGELGRLPSHWSLEGLDEKIAMMEAKRELLQRGRAAEEVDALLQCLRNRKKYDDRGKWGVTHREFFARFDTTDHRKVEELCARHNLVFRDADLFIPDMPPDATAAMKEFTDRCVVIGGKKPRIYVIATSDQFRDVSHREEKKRDPIVLAQSPFGFYYHILGAWDAEMLYLPEL